MVVPLYNFDLSGCPMSLGYLPVRYFALVHSPSCSQCLGPWGLLGARRFLRPEKAIIAPPNVPWTSRLSMSRITTTVATGTRTPRRSETVSRVPRATVRSKLYST